MARPARNVYGCVLLVIVAVVLFVAIYALFAYLFSIPVSY
jgi:hypothetical protein